MPTQNNFETRNITFDLQGVETREDKTNVIRGVAIKYNSLSLPMYNNFYERIARGALDKTLKEDDQVALWGHDDKHVLGRKSQGTLILRDEPDGLHFEIEPPDTTWAKDLVTSVKRGDIKQMSFGFKTIVDKWYSDADTRKKHGLQIREILELKLYEISLVAFPAYPQTSVRDAKNSEHIPQVPAWDEDKNKLAASYRSREIDIQKRKINNRSKA